MENQSLSEIVIDEMKRQGLSKAELARQAGVSYDTVRELERRPGSSTTYENGVRLLKALGFEPDGPGIGGVTQIPRYDIQLSAGHGAINFEGERKEIPIPFAPDFLEKKLGRSSQDGLTIVEAAGDSMLPTIAGEDLIMLDMHDTERSAGIFGFEMGGETFVKRLEWTEYGVQIISDNEHYPPRAMNAEKAEAEGFRLIGRVVWVGRVF